MNFKVVVILLAGILIIGPIGLQTISGQNMQKRETEVRLEAGERYKNPRRNNIGSREDMRDMKTNTEVWQEDMGEDAPKGVYRGPLFKPSLMQLDHKPQYRWKLNDLPPDPSFGRKTEGDISTTSIIQEANFSSSHIMNGASEVWVQVPVDTSCLSTIDLIYDNEGLATGPHYGKFYSSVHLYKGEIDDIDVQMDGTAISQQSTATIDDTTKTPEAVVPILPKNYHNNKPYVKLNTFIESDVTYSFVFNLITETTKPRLFVTSSDNFGSVTIQQNKETGLSTNINIDLGNAMANPDEFGFNNSPYIFGSSDYNYEKENYETDIHLATSFMFTKGIGNHYMFGRELEIDAGDSLLFYPDIDWSNYDDGNKRTSFYLPFISENRLGNESIGSKNISIGVMNHEVSISPSENHNWENPNWTYQNFILYTNPENWTSKGESGGDIISIYFNDRCTLTLPFTARDYTYDFYDDGSIPYVQKQSARWSESQMMKQSRYTDSHEVWNYSDKEFYYYNPYIVAELTEKVWAQVSSRGNGQESYSHAFEPVAYYSNIELAIDLKNNDEDDGIDWRKKIKMIDKGFQYTVPAYWAARQFVDADSDTDPTSDPIGYLADKIKNGVTRIASKVEKVIGRIYDGLQWIWNQIKNVLDVIYNEVIEFIGWIVNLVEDIGQVLGTLAERVAYIAGLLAFVGVTAAVSKITKLSEWGGKI